MLSEPTTGKTHPVNSPGLAFLVAGAIGFLLGFERERHAFREGEPAPALGTRTLTVLALAGALAGALSTSVVAAGLIAVAVTVVVSYWRTSIEHQGLTTEMTALVTFLLGAYTHVDAAMAAGLAVAIAVLLEQKTRLRHLLRDVVTDVEVDDALRYVAMAVIVLPLLPDRDIDRWGVINPRELWTLVVILAGIGWAGYIATRIFGPRRGLPVTGLAGGFVSGSATTGMMARISRSGPAAFRPSMAGALAASVGTCIQIVLITAVVDSDIALAVLPAMAVGAAVLIVEMVVVARGTQADAATQSAADESLTHRRPLQLTASLTIAVILTGSLVLSKALSEQFGSGAAVITAAVAGLADAHAPTMSAASLADDGIVSRSTAIAAIGAALATNTVVKLVLAAAAGGRRFVARLTLAFAAPVTAVAVLLWWSAVRW